MNLSQKQKLLTERDFTDKRVFLNTVTMSGWRIFTGISVAIYENILNRCSTSAFSNNVSADVLHSIKLRKIGQWF